MLHKSWDALDLWALGQHCIKNRDDSVMQITEEVICEHDPEILLVSSVGQSSFKMDRGEWETVL